MAFLTPLFLFGLLAALIPVAIHLIRKEKPTKVIFSSIRFLKKTARKLVLIQHIQQWLLLLLRSAVIALLVFAFARPLFDQSLARLLDTGPMSAVIMLDVSMSMRYGDSFDRAKQAALELLNEMAAGDEVALIGFSGTADAVRELNTDIDSARSLINSISEPGYGATRYMPNLRLADQLLETSRHEKRRIYLISDYQAVAMSDTDDGWKLAPGTAFAGIDVGAIESSNLLLADVRSPHQLLEGAGEQQILARVRSTGSLYVQQGDASLYVDGELIERNPVDLADRSEQVLTFTASFDTPGSHSAEVRVSGDNFRLDNSWFFTLDVLPKIRVLLVNGEASDDWFDDEAHWFELAVRGAGQSPFVLETIVPAQLSAASLRQNDVAVLLNVGDLSTAQAAAIENYVQAGGSLLLAPGDRVKPEVFNRQLANVAPALLQGRGQSGLDDYLVLADFDSRHPVLSSLGSDWSARFQNHWSLLANEEADLLMQFDNAEPALLERRAAEGNVLLFASALDLEWNNLALQAVFLPFVHETLRHLAQQNPKQRAWQVGDSIDLDPAGTAQSVEAFDATGAAIEFAGQNFVITAESPGMITARIDGSPVHHAVNSIPEESYFSRVAVATLYDRISNPDTEPNRSREARSAQLTEELERPQRLWWWIICLVMLLLLVEATLANRSYR